MSLIHSPSIVTNGLVLYTDMSNTQKSWKGAPTTNLIATVPFVSTVYTACTGPVSVTALDAAGQPRTVNRYTITTASGTTPRARINCTGLVTGVNYTYSCKIKYNGPGAAAAWYIDASKGNPEGTNNTFTTHSTSAVAIGNDWYQLTENFNYATSPTLGAYANFGLAAPDATFLNQTFDAYDIQFEQNLYLSPYVAGIRTNTQALVDLTGNNTLTATSLTYASDGTFSFGGSDFIDCGSNTSIKPTGVITVDMWIYFASITAGNRVFSDWHQLGDTADRWIFYNPDVTSIQWLVHTIGASDTTTSYTPALNTWINLVGTYDGINMRLYANGVQVSSLAKVGLMPAGSGYSVRIGKQAETGTGHNGKISAAKIYSRALSADEVLQNFTALRGRYGI
jgi:hypothetical protein